MGIQGEHTIFLEEQLPLKPNTMNSVRYFFLIISVLIPSYVIGQRDTVVITDGDLRWGRYSWQSDKIYLLDGQVTMEAGSLLIEPGTQIIAKAAPSDPQQVTSSLILAPGATLAAIGTEEDPIIFTTEDKRNWSGVGFTGGRKVPAWGGITLQGGENMGTKILRYVQISFAGKGNETEIGAALFLDHVDKNTRIDFIEIYASEGDGIRIHGGDADISNAVVSFTQDDAFDWDFGWTGRGLYWFAFKFGIVANDQILSDRSYGIEGKGNIGRNGRISNPQIFNATLVGQTCGEVLDVSQLDGGVFFKDNSAGLLANSLILDFPVGALKVEDLTGQADCRQQIEAGNLLIANNTWWSIGAERPGSLGLNTGFFKTFGPTPEGIILVDSNYESSNAAYLTKHLSEQSNFYQGLGIRTNRESAICIALDPRPDTLGAIGTPPNLPYPDDSFFQSRIEDRMQKGAFNSRVLWTEGWTRLEKDIYLGKSATMEAFYRGQLLKSKDTLRIDCDELHFLQDSFGISDIVCPPWYDLVAAVSRRGNRRRRPKNLEGEVVTPKTPITFVHDWLYTSSDYGCHSRDSFSLTVLVYDTIAPIIHPIPDGRGGVTAFTQDCDVSWIDGVEVDTMQMDGGTYVKYLFSAQDSSGNSSQLCLEQQIGPDTHVVFVDLDGDGFGDPNFPLPIATGPTGDLLIPEGFVADSLDCNDENPTVPYLRPFFNEIICDPPADLCTDAKSIEITDFIHCQELEIGASTPSFSYYLPESCSSFFQNFRDSWIRFDAPLSGRVYLRLSFYEPNLTGGFIGELYRGDCSALEQVACFEDGNTKEEYKIVDLIPGKSYYLRIIDAANLSTSRVSVCLAALELISENVSCGESNSLAFSEGCFSGDFTNISVPVRPDTTGLNCEDRNARSLWFDFETGSLDSMYISMIQLSEEYANLHFRLFSGDCNDLRLIYCSSESYSDTVRAQLSSLPNTGKIYIQTMEANFQEIAFRLDICKYERIVSQNKAPQLANGTLDLFPNPSVSGFLNYRLSALPSEKLMLRVYSPQGKMMKEVQNIHGFGGFDQGQIDLRFCPAGLYYVQMISDNVSLTRKVIVNEGR